MELCKIVRVQPNVMKQKGQSLIEVLVALGSAILVISAISTAIVTSLNNAQFSRSQEIASQYAQEGVEIMRKMRDANWATFNAYRTGSPGPGTYCLSKSATSPGNTKVTNVVAECGENITDTNNVNFIRTVTVEYPSTTFCQPTVPTPSPTPAPANATRIISTVYWKDSKCNSGNSADLYCHKAQQVVCLTDYTVLPTP